MDIPGASLYKVERGDKYILSFTPRRQFLTYRYHDSPEPGRYEWFTEHFNVPLPYMHFVMQKISFNTPSYGEVIGKLVTNWYTQAIVSSVDPVDSVEDIADLKVFSPILPNMYYLSGERIRDIIDQGMIYDADDYDDERCTCGCADGDEDQFSYPLIGKACFIANSHSDPLQCVNDFWAQPFNTDLYYQYLQHPFIKSINTGEFQANLIADNASWHKISTSILAEHETLSVDDVIKVIQDNNMADCSFVHVDPIMTGSVQEIDLEVGCAS